MSIHLDDQARKRAPRMLQQQPLRESDPQQQRWGSVEYQRSAADAGAAWVRWDSQSWEVEQRSRAA